MSWQSSGNCQTKVWGVDLVAGLQGCGGGLVGLFAGKTHRYTTAIEACALPVGAGMPAKRPALPSIKSRSPNLYSL
ncbi:hypothetical protein CXG50_27240 [Pseudomonas plecoglossicida]|nr:hypothetical protein CX682_30930 [Pseudomonas sp. FFUP_PS_41]PLU90506.1 hypothetical protein CXG52_26890 [Pseudomonas plecoglossicida]PLV02229.1 hypothetical protein CXG50_27240 [Pseudomonas plecoglossicida]